MFVTQRTFPSIEEREVFQELVDSIADNKKELNTYYKIVIYSCLTCLNDLVYAKAALQSVLHQWLLDNFHKLN